MKIRVDSLDSPIGTVCLAVRADEPGRDALCALGFEDGWDRLLSAVEKRVGSLEQIPGGAPRSVLSALAEYFRGDLRSLDAVPVDLSGTPFQKQVWAALRAIPPGSTVSYAELARRLGRPKSVRAVGGANGSNPVSLVVPCHRVIAADGTLGGYGWGLARKEWLLRHEGGLPATLPSVHYLGASPAPAAEDRRSFKPA